jgi:opacity protein-like surface antigen
MKKIILATAAFTLLTGSAFADVVNANGERKYDAASLMQAGKLVTPLFSKGVDYTPTASIGGGSSDEGFVLNSNGERKYDAASQLQK